MPGRPANDTSKAVSFDSWFESKNYRIPLRGAAAVLRLTEEGSTIPFIARYRKEQTGNLDEVAIQTVIDAKEEWDKVVKRQAFIVGEIDRQKKLTPELSATILATFELETLEDLYLPFKVKRKTKAALAKEAGIEPLADWIWNCGHGSEIPQPGQTLEIWAFTFRNEEKGFTDAAASIQGAQDILIERLSEIHELRQLVRSAVFEKGCLQSKKADKVKPKSKYENYFDHREPLRSLLEPQNSHRYLAMRRGRIEEEIQLSITGAPDNPEFEQILLNAFEAAACTVRDSVGSAVLLQAARLALRVSVFPSIESEAHKALKEVADHVAIQVFSENVKKLLLASPFGSKAVLGIDPGLRTGCKVAVVDASGKFVASTVIHLQSDAEKKKATDAIVEAIRNTAIEAIAVGNGTAGRETEVFVRKSLKEAGVNVPVVMVSESGASVYSASDIAREEFPDLDITVRGAISIARRLQDPLAELVKTDPKSIGVGQYQHDIAPASLKKSLDLVVDTCVNGVGVNLNTASSYLLSHVSGIGPALAKAIVEYRSEKGLFSSRKQLFDIPRFSTKAFEQAAGFLRIHQGENPLDNTGVHPERYGVLEAFANKIKSSIRDLLGPGARALRESKELREELGDFTFDDIVRELEKPGRDPRELFVSFQFREDIYELTDLKTGMTCPGIVTNVTNFGAFVDIGVHQDGLVHISQLSDQFIKDPRDVVNPGDRVNVRILEVNQEKRQIALSLKAELKAKPKPERRAPEPRHERKPELNPGRNSGKKLTPQGPGLPSVQQNRTKPRPLSPAPPRTLFNNPFQGLASLKGTLKPK